MRKQVGALGWRRKKNRLEILLVTSRETSRWVIPKGWPMEHLIDSNAAKLEAFEEAGIAGHVSRTAIGVYNYDKRLGSGDMVGCQVTVYPIEVTGEHAKWPEKHQRKRRWFAPHDAAWEVDEPGLKAIIWAFAGD
jgi:8-oxo-dGTP pyrophosphatase MutT (NUDIX family)